MAEGIITSSFGHRENPVLKREEFHDGIDIAAELGSGVIAVKSGRVTEVGTSDTFGKYLLYETPDGFTIKYAHLSEHLVREGEKVEKGQTVAKSGNTGLSTGAHLHYSIIFAGEYIDPLIYLNLPYTENVLEEYITRNALKAAQ